MSLFCYSKVMNKIKVDSNQEIIITVGDLLMMVDGLAHISSGISEITNKISEKEARNIAIPMIATFASVAKLFPRKQKKQIFSELKKVIGVDLGDMF